MKHFQKFIFRVVVILSMILYPLLFIFCRSLIVENKPPVVKDFVEGYSELWKMLKNGFL